MNCCFVYLRRLLKELIHLSFAVIIIIYGTVFRVNKDVNDYSGGGEETPAKKWQSYSRRKLIGKNPFSEAWLKSISDPYDTPMPVDYFNDVW